MVMRLPVVVSFLRPLLTCFRQIACNTNRRAPSFANFHSLRAAEPIPEPGLLLLCSAPFTR